MLLWTCLYAAAAVLTVACDDWVPHDLSCDGANEACHVRAMMSFSPSVHRHARVASLETCEGLAGGVCGREPRAQMNCMRSQTCVGMCMHACKRGAQVRAVWVPRREGGGCSYFDLACMAQKIAVHVAMYQKLEFEKYRSEVKQQPTCETQARPC